jgi:hypothetical protein
MACKPVAVVWLADVMAIPGVGFEVSRGLKMVEVLIYIKKMDVGFHSPRLCYSLKIEQCLLVGISASDVYISPPDSWGLAREGFPAREVRSIVECTNEKLCSLMLRM